MDLKTYRETNELSQQAFADKLTDAGYPATQALVSQWESGAVKFTAERARQIHEVTQGDVPRDFLLFGEEPSKGGKAAA